MADKQTIANMPRAAFRALALLHVYFYADLAWPEVRTAEGRKRQLRILHKHGLLKDVSSVEHAGHAVLERYNKAIEDHVGNTMPDGWEPTHDYWGAKCVAYDPGWNAPKIGTYFTGDASARYMAFDGPESLERYTTRILKEINEREHRHSA